MCNTNVKKNILWKFAFTFKDIDGANYKFKFGTDFGWGAAVFVDDKF